VEAKSSPSEFPLPDAAQELAKRLAQGQSLLKAVGDLPITPTEAEKWVSDPRFIEMVQEATIGVQEVAQEVDRLIPLALKTRREILENPNASLSLKERVAGSLLESRGYAALDVNKKVVYEIPRERRVLLKETLRELLGAIESQEQEGS
jgi:hypothetical protein